MKAVVMLYGEVARDPQMRFSAEGKGWCTFSVRSVDKRGEKEFTSYHDVVAWDSSYRPLATWCAEHLRNGSGVVVMGTLRYRKDEQSGKFLAQINADDVEVVSSPGTKKEDDGDDEDTPF